MAHVALHTAYSSGVTSLLHYLVLFQRNRGLYVLVIDKATDDFLDQYRSVRVRSVRLHLFRHEALHNLDKQIVLAQSTLPAFYHGGKANEAFNSSSQAWNPGAVQKIAPPLPFALVADHLTLILGHIMQRTGQAPCGLCRFR